jgi:hypothetical protein
MIQDDAVKIARGVATVWILTALVTAPDLRIVTMLNTLGEILKEAREKDESHIVRGYD